MRHHHHFDTARPDLSAVLLHTDDDEASHDYDHERLSEMPDEPCRAGTTCGYRRHDDG